jgi:hypothetical protein
MKPLANIAILLSLFLVPAISFATEGKIVEHKADCGYFIIQGEKGYLFVKQQSHNTNLSKPGDIIDGVNLGNFGIMSLHNTTSNETFWIFNENSWLSKDDAVEKYVAKCGPIETHPIKDLINKVTGLIPHL